MSRYQPIWRRLMGKVLIAENGCWLFTGSLDGTGYGQIYWNGRLHAAHRVAHEYFIGPIPDGYEVDHLCGVYACVSPHHIEAVTPTINKLRSAAPMAQRWREARCKRGHPMVEGNLYRYKSRTGHECKTCMLIRNLRRHHTHRPETISKYQINKETVHVRI